LATVEIYLKTTCPYCVRAMQMLRSKRIEPRQYVLDGGGPQRQEMIERSGGRMTVPQIFIDGRHVGGCDDLMALERQGRLDALLAV
jgi:glutaredoxin 3